MAEIRCTIEFVKIVHINLYSTSTGGTLSKAAENALDYLRRSLNDKGRFAYIRNLGSVASRPHKYNLVRHAGALLCLLEHSKKHSPLNTKAVDFLLKHARPIPDNANDVLAVAKNGKSKLGATALTLAAVLADKGLDSGRKRFAQRFANFLLSQQDSTGHFRSLYFASGDEYIFESLYYPGEAVLALVRAAVHFSDDKYATAAFRGASFLAQRYLGMKTSDLPADHWLMLAIREIYAIAPDRNLWAAMNRLGDAIVDTAERDRTEGLVYWGRDARMCPTACRAEGLAAAVELNIITGQIEKAFHFLVCLEQAVTFCLQHQVGDVFVAQFPLARNLLGGFVHSKQNPMVRIDFVQHAIGAIHGLLRVRDLIKLRNAPLPIEGNNFGS